MLFFLEMTNKVIITQEGWDLDIRSTDVTSMFFITENGARNYNDKSISYSSFSSIEEIKAMTLVPTKRKPQKIPVSEIEEKSVLSGGVFFDDRKEKSFSFPGAIPGSVGFCSYTESVKEPRFLGSFYFNSYLPVEKAFYSISFPESVKVNYILRGETDSDIKFERKSEKGVVTLTWEASEREELEFEDNAPDIRFTAPHVILFIEQIENDGEIKPILNGVEGLYAWYNDLTKDVNSSPDPELNKIVGELIADSKTDEEKVRSIFAWVQSNIKYIAFEDGLGGFVPREATDVFTKRYGDCKDMSSIIYEMLKAADLDASLTWIGTRDIPYSYEEVPTPAVDNHMIASIELGGQRIFLDATDEYVPFGWPTGFIQGKQALVGKGEQGFELVDVQVMPKDSSGKSGRGFDSCRR